ncbi:winged helix-turn-helix domain-containing protein [Roseicyclus mahoneyensis]|nr:winged helix-turn-helix domain-containing protein [Roseicyclus mahoneyensis]
MLLDAVARGRPDYVILGAAAEDADLAALRAAMHTATLGIVLIGPQGATPAPGPQFGIETFDPADGPDAFTLRLRALMRRCRPVALASRCRAGGLTLDEAAMTVSVAGSSATLSLEDFRLLGPLFDMPGRVWPREELLRLAYGSQTQNGLRTIDVKLNRTRRRMRAALGHDPIRSVRGEGYMLAPD